MRSMDRIADGNVTLLIEATFLLLAIIFSFFVFIPISSSLNTFQHHLNGSSGCMLFADVTGDESGSSERPTLKASNPSKLLCDYSVAVGIVALIFSVVSLAQVSVHLIRGTKWSWAISFIRLSINALLLVFSLVSGLILALGLRKFCNGLMAYGHENRCRDVELRFPDGSLDTTDFYIQYTVAIIGSWSIFISYFVLVLISWRRMCLHHSETSRLINSHRERGKVYRDIPGTRSYSSLTLTSDTALIVETSPQQSPTLS